MGRHSPARTGARLQGPPRLDHADLRRRGGCHRPDRGQDEADGAGVRGSPPLNPILSCPPKRVSPSASPMTGSGAHQYAGNPRSFADVSGILGRPVPATPRLRRGCTVAQYWLAGALAEAASRAMTSSLRIEPTSAAGPVALARLLSRRSEPQLRRSWWICPAAVARRPRQ